MKYKFKKHFQEDKGWVLAQYDFDVYMDGASSLARQADERGEDWFFVIKTWFYKSACAPFMQFCYSFEDLKEEVEKACAGDIIEVWFVNESNRQFSLKLPDENNMIPEKGAY
jgi:hypothetical protein